MNIARGSPDSGYTQPVRRSAAILAMMFAIAALLCSPADAKRKRKRRGRANMPANWVWPPSKQMKAVGAECRDELTALGVAWKRGSKTRKVATSVVVPSMELGELKLTPIFRKPPFVMDCHLARALVHVAPVFRAAGIAELRFSSIHTYRRVRTRGRTKKALSRHALGLAIDVYEMVTDTGETLVVQRDYGNDDGARLIPLEIALVSTGEFRALLTPGNDPRSHYDHFHFEARMTVPGAPAKKRRRSRARKKKPARHTKPASRSRRRDRRHEPKPRS